VASRETGRADRRYAYELLKLLADAVERILDRCPDIREA
jgi:hypothetical protein